MKVAYSIFHILYIDNWSAFIMFIMKLTEIIHSNPVMITNFKV